MTLSHYLWASLRLKASNQTLNDEVNCLKSLLGFKCTWQSAARIWATYICPFYLGLNPPSVIAFSSDESFMGIDVIDISELTRE